MSRELIGYYRLFICYIAQARFWKTENYLGEAVNDSKKTIQNKIKILVECNIMLNRIQLGSLIIIKKYFDFLTVKMQNFVVIIK